MTNVGMRWNQRIEIYKMVRTRAKLDRRIMMITAVSKYLFSISRKVVSRRRAQPCQKGDSVSAKTGNRSYLTNKSNKSSLV